MNKILKLILVFFLILGTFICGYFVGTEGRTKNESNETVALKFECDHCDEHFHSEEDLNDHVNGMHRFECEKCHQIFITREHLANHVRISHRTENRATAPVAAQHKCLKCGQTFSSEDELYEHIKTAHGRYACRICGQDIWFPNERDLKHHIKNMHNDEM